MPLSEYAEGRDRTPLRKGRARKERSLEEQIRQTGKKLQKLANAKGKTKFGMKVE